MPPERISQTMGPNAQSRRIAAELLDPWIIHGGALRSAFALICGLFLLFDCGCAERNGVLEVDSGPQVRFVSDTGRTDVPVYAVHVGESFAMRFRARMGVCDYAVLHDEGEGKYYDCGSPAAGAFEWTHSVDAEAAVGVQRRLTVDGYAQKGARDRMPIRGKLVDGERPDDPQDWRLAQASVWIEPYQSVLDTTFALEGARPDWNLSKLVVRRSDGRQTTIRAANGESRGFTGTGPDEQGRWRVRYEPACSEVDSSGEASAELVVADEEGRTTVIRFSFSTP